MTITNEELVEKAVIATDALASAGKLNDAQSDKFLDYVFDETSLKNDARTVRFRNENMVIDKIGIGRRAAMAAAEATDPGRRRSVTHTKVTLTPKEIIVPVELTTNYMEINIEGDSVEDHIMRMFAAQFGNDVEELLINGNILGPATLEDEMFEGGSTTQYVKDTYLGLLDGYGKKANSANIVDASGSNIGLSIFAQAIRALPTKFRKNKKKLRFFMSPDLASLYAEKMSSRVGKSGEDAAGGNPLNPYGIPITEVALWDFLPPVTEHIVLTGTAATSLINAPVSNVVVVPITISDTPTTPYVEGSGNDYILDATNGTIARDATSTIGDGATVKVTYTANPQMILTHINNFIYAIGRDVTIEKDRDIFKRVNQYAITAKVDAQFEELSAIVKVRNLGTGI